MIEYGDRDPEGVYVATSGGKDSVVVHHLAMLAFGSSVPLIHTPKVTGFNKVHPATVAFLYEQSAKYGLSIVPFERMKWHLKSHKLHIQVDGTRRSEFDRTDRSADVVVNGKLISRADMPVHTVGGLFDNESIFPIVDWSDDDVWAYIGQQGIEVTEEYRILSTR
ncbi:phosphoadenosine phosphosulfate reductase family protein [Xanthomonas phage BUDD]|nr:phosphoadenosine phosphosulfate reductase family protein [Xanthomonas phage BUDD]